jgi:hypothetical protein
MVPQATIAEQILITIKAAQSQITTWLSSVGMIIILRQTLKRRLLEMALSSVRIAGEAVLARMEYFIFLTMIQILEIKLFLM